MTELHRLVPHIDFLLGQTVRTDMLIDHLTVPTAKFDQGCEIAPRYTTWRISSLTSSSIFRSSLDLCMRFCICRSQHHALAYIEHNCRITSTRVQR